MLFGPAGMGVEDGLVAHPAVAEVEPSRLVCVGRVGGGGTWPRIAYMRQPRSNARSRALRYSTDPLRHRRN